MDQNPQSAGNQQSPLTPTVVPGYPPQPPRRPFSWARLVAILLALGLFGSLMINFLLVVVLGLTAAEGEAKVQEKFFSHNEKATDKVAIFSIEGVIVGGEGFFKRQIDRAARRPRKATSRPSCCGSTRPAAP